MRELVRYLLYNTNNYRVKLGDLNNFLETFIRQALSGMVTSLKGCSDAKEITLTIKRKNTHE